MTCTFSHVVLAKVASIAYNFDTRGSDLLDYTTLNVESIDYSMFIDRHDNA